MKRTKSQFYSLYRYYYTEQPEINRLKPTCSFSKKDTHTQSAPLMSVLRAKADILKKKKIYIISNLK